MTPDEAFAAIAAHHSDQIVVTGLGTATQEWHRIFGPHDDDAFHMHTMGLASSFGLGLALACPEAQVWAFEGDGGLIMNLGSLVTIAHQQPPNMKLIVVANRRYGTIDGPALPNAERSDFGAMARAAGIARVQHFATVDEIAAAMPEALCADGFAFAVLEVERGALDKPLAWYEGAEIKYRFGRYMEQRTGRAVFGPLGY